MSQDDTMAADGWKNPNVVRPAKPASLGSDVASALLGGEIEILSSRPLPHLDKGPVKAYAARRRDQGADGCYAMICEPHLVPRSGESPSYAGLSSPALPRLVASGPVFWPPASGARYCFVYENNLGKPITADAEQPDSLGWRQDVLMRTAIKPLVQAVCDLHAAGIVHGDIRPANMFDGGDDNHERIMLGECLSTPPSYTQPVFYETVERAMYDPIGKGRGSFADDFYALGASLAAVIRRKNPVEGLSAREIIHEKMTHGSFHVLVGKERITGLLLELMRGLLYDDRDQRWTRQDVMSWLEGQSPNTRQSYHRRRVAARPLSFNGQSYDRQALLAMDLSKNPAETVQLIESGALEQWVTRSLEDTVLKERIDESVESAREPGRGNGYPERLASRVSAVLDPEGPARYKDFNLHPDGFARALAEAVALKHDLQPYAEMISQQVFMFWIDQQGSIKSETKEESRISVSTFDSCRGFMRQNSIGYGIERCLYFLSADVPCQSDRLKKYYVRTPEDMLYAFEVISKQADRPMLFLDRHIAAFLSVKDRKTVDIFSADLNASEAERRIMGNIKILASVQKRGKLGAFPGITKWMAEIVEPVYERFHDRKLREHLRKSVARLSDTGDIMQIAVLLDDFETIQQDFNGFRAAMMEYYQLREEMAQIEQQLERPETFARGTASEVAAIVSGIVSGIIVLGFTFLHLFGKG